MSDGGATALIAVAMVVGAAGTVVPIVPGVWIIWVAALAYGFLVGFGSVGLLVVAGMTGLLAVSVVSGVLIPRHLAQEANVSGWSQLVAVVGAVIGFFTIPLVGIIVGALIAVFIAEFVHHREVEAAWRATVAVAKGFGIATLVEIAVAVLMVALWSLWAASVVL